MPTQYHPDAVQPLGPNDQYPSYEDKINSALSQLVLVLLDLNGLIGGSETLTEALNLRIAELQTQIDASLVEDDGLSIDLKGNNRKATQFADATQPADLVTLSQAQALLSLGGTPAAIAVTSLNRGTAVSGQAIGVKDNNTLGGLDFVPWTYGGAVRANLLPNSSWSLGTMGWRNASSSRPSITQGSTAGTAWGYGSASLTNYTAGQTVVWESTALAVISAAQTYTLAADFRLDSVVSGKFYIDVQWLDASFVTLGDSPNVEAVAGDSWRRRAAQITAPAGAAYGRVRVIWETLNAPAAVAGIARIKLELGSISTMWSDDASAVLIGGRFSGMTASAAGVWYPRCGDIVTITSTSAAVEIRSWAQPEDGDWYRVINATSRRDHVLGRNGKSFNGVLQDLVIDKPYWSVLVRYRAASNSWYLES